MQEKFIHLFFDEGNNVVDNIVKNIEVVDEFNSVLTKYNKTLGRIKKDLGLIAAFNKKNRTESFGTLEDKLKDRQQRRQQN